MMQCSYISETGIQCTHEAEYMLYNKEPYSEIPCCERHLIEFEYEEAEPINGTK